MRITTLLKHAYLKIIRANMAKRQKLFWDKNCIIEFWLDGFNDDGLEVAFLHLVEIYDQILHKDPQWHYFYEDRYSLIRCSMKYRDKVKNYLDKNNIQYKWPAYQWSESLDITVVHQDIFKEMFHSFSVLVIKMFKQDTGKYLSHAADRVCHCFLNHAIYLAEAEGKLDVYKNSDMEPMMWEADQMAQLTSYRAYHIGIIKGEKRVQKWQESRRIAEEEKGKECSE